jgi:hypothetical protein
LRFPVAVKNKGSSGFRVGQRPRSWRHEAGGSRLGRRGRGAAAVDSWGQAGGVPGRGDLMRTQYQGKPERARPPRVSWLPARTWRRSHPARGITHPHRIRKSRYSFDHEQQGNPAPDRPDSLPLGEQEGDTGAGVMIECQRNARIERGAAWAVAPGSVAELTAGPAEQRSVPAHPCRSVEGGGSGCSGPPPSPSSGRSSPAAGPGQT